MKTLDEHIIKKKLQKTLLIQKPNVEDKDITLDLLFECRAIMAKVIKEKGKIFLPIFIRIENEIENKKVENHYKNIALQIAENQE